ncbi:MAG: hypothetical protein BWX87_01793 [Bacteroidetes bacterium ADurb.Bin123]|nr:MAG: hypothetical protein BWX87_01793 [Bacteroidetes bacterium ADurb.Bin123]
MVSSQNKTMPSSGGETALRQMCTHRNDLFAWILHLFLGMIHHKIIV